MATGQIPWVRVLVEGVVIVGSILLALALDAWWDEVQEGERELQYLEALHSEFQSVLAEIEEDFARREARTAAADQILASIAARDSAEPESVAANLQQLTGIARFLPPHAVYDDLVASGNLRLLSPNLRLALLAYGEEADRLRWSEDRANTSYLSGLQPYLQEHADLLLIEAPTGIAGLDHPTTFPSGLDEMLADRRFQNFMVTRLENLNYSQGTTVILKQVVEDLMSLLQAEID